MARLPNFLVIIRSEKLSGKGQGRGAKKRTFRFGKKNVSFPKVETFRFADYILFLKEEMSSMEIFRIEEEVRKNEEEITKNIKVKEKLVRNSLGISSLPVEVINLYPEVTTDAEAG